jgi:hypothetical protein
MFDFCMHHQVISALRTAGERYKACKQTYSEKQVGGSHVPDRQGFRQARRGVSRSILKLELLMSGS